MLTFVALNHQKFTVTFQMHKIILHLFWRRSFCASWKEYATCSYCLQMFECVCACDGVKDDSQRCKNEKVAAGISIRVSLQDLLEDKALCQN